MRFGNLTVFYFSLILYFILAANIYNWWYAIQSNIKSCGVWFIRNCIIFLAKTEEGRVPTSISLIVSALSTSDETETADGNNYGCEQ